MIWQWLAGNDWPEWPEFSDFPPGPPPPARVPKGTLRITPVGHSTFLIQMDGLNILVDPVWSDRSSPVSWAGPRRHSRPGLRLEDLPAIDAVQELAATLKKRNLNPDAFIALSPGQSREWGTPLNEIGSPVPIETLSIDKVR